MKYVIINYSDSFSLVKFEGRYKVSYENTPDKYKSNYYKIVTASQLKKIEEMEKKIVKLNKEIQEELKRLFEKGEKLR